LDLSQTQFFINNVQPLLTHVASPARSPGQAKLLLDSTISQLADEASKLSKSRDLKRIESKLKKFDAIAKNYTG
jgi:hypothetical protein